MVMNRLQEFLDANRVRYGTLRHRTAFTAQEIAASAHIPGNEFAKTVIVKLDGRMAMVVLPAHRAVSAARLKEVTGADRVELAAEADFSDRFPDCEVGAMPPFGNLFGMDVFVDRRLAEDPKIAFNAGDHRELVALSYEDFADLVAPTVADLSAPR